MFSLFGEFVTRCHVIMQHKLESKYLNFLFILFNNTLLLLKRKNIYIKRVNNMTNWKEINNECIRRKSIAKYNSCTVRNYKNRNVEYNIIIIFSIDPRHLGSQKRSSVHQSTTNVEFDTRHLCGVDVVVATMLHHFQSWFRSVTTNYRCKGCIMSKRKEGGKRMLICVSHFGMK